MTLADISASTGISVTSLSLISTGKQRPSFDTLEKVAAVLHVSIAELFCDEQLTALVMVGDKCYKATTVAELENICTTLKKQNN